MRQTAFTSHVIIGQAWIRHIKSTCSGKVIITVGAATVYGKQWRAQCLLHQWQNSITLTHQYACEKISSFYIKTIVKIVKKGWNNNRLFGKLQRCPTQIALPVLRLRQWNISCFLTHHLRRSDRWFSLKPHEQRSHTFIRVCFNWDRYPIGGVQRSKFHSL